jgi:hypothetical protein
MGGGHTVNPSKQSALAERFENFRLVTVLTFVFLGLNNAMEAIGYHYPPTEFLWTKIGLMLLDLAVLLSCMMVLIGVFRLRELTPHIQKLLMEEFVQKINMKAMAASWIFTIFAVQAVSEWTEPDVMFFGAHDVTALPATKHYMHIVVSCMTLSYGLFFLLLYRKSTPGDEA